MFSFVIPECIWTRAPSSLNLSFKLIPAKRELLTTKRSCAPKLTRYSCKFVPCQSVTVIYRVLVCLLEMTKLLFKGKRLYAMGPEKARMKCDLNGFNTIMGLPCEFCNKVTEKNSSHFAHLFCYLLIFRK